MTPADPRPDDAPPLTGEARAFHGRLHLNMTHHGPCYIEDALRRIEREARADAEARLGEVLELLVYSDVPQRIVDRAHDIAALAPRGGGE